MQHGYHMILLHLLQIAFNVPFEAIEIPGTEPKRHKMNYSRPKNGVFNLSTCSVNAPNQVENIDYE